MLGRGSWGAAQWRARNRLGWWAPMGGDPLRDPLREPPAHAARATAATPGGQRLGVRPKQVCCAALGAPSGSLLARGGAAGGAASPAGRGARGGQGVRVRPTRRSPSPGRRVSALGSSPGAQRGRQLRGRGAAGRQWLLGVSQAGRAPAWEKSCKPSLGEGKQGAQRERRSRGGKEPEA